MRLISVIRLLPTVVFQLFSGNGGGNFKPIIIKDIGVEYVENDI